MYFGVYKAPSSGPLKTEREERVMARASPLFTQDISIWQGYNKLHQPV